MQILNPPLSGNIYSAEHHVLVSSSLNTEYSERFVLQKLNVNYLKATPSALEVVEIIQAAAS